METESLIGKTLVCAETGKAFVGAYDGCSTNYARDKAGRVYSDEGVHIRESREVQAHNAPFFAYVSSDGTAITGWKGNKHMTVTAKGKTGSGFGGSQWHIEARDTFGNWWHGLNGGPGMYIRMRPKKSPR